MYNKGRTGDEAVLPLFGVKWMCRLFVAASPDVHFFRFGNELVAELGMGDGDDGFSPLPGGQAL